MEPVRLNAAQIATVIDHTLLRPEATAAQVRLLCEEAVQYGFATVCVHPVYVLTASELLRGSGTKVGTVVGFPLGANETAIKVQEARLAVRQGVGEVDMVLRIGALKGEDDESTYRDIAEVVQTAHEGGAICKVILETALLNDDEKVRACRLAVRAGADFVKTSTGFGPGGATVQNVALLAKTVAGTGLGVKASGGIRSYADALGMIEAGATRLGTSAGVEIVRQAREHSRG